MELQSDREAVELSETLSGGSTELVAFPPDVGENATDLLNDRCDVCSQNLQACIVATQQAALASSTYEKARLRAIVERLQEHQVRFDIWKTDCDFSRNSISIITREQEASLDQLINDVFTRMSANLSLLQIHIGQRLQEVAELQPSIQMAHAVHGDEEPYNMWRKNLDNIHERYTTGGKGNYEKDESEKITEEKIDHPSGSERCAQCNEWPAYHAMEFHTRTCPGTVGDSPAIVAPVSPSVKKSDAKWKWRSSDSAAEKAGSLAIESTSSLGRIDQAASRAKRDKSSSFIRGSSKTPVPPLYYGPLKRNDFSSPETSLRTFLTYLWGISASRSAKSVHEKWRYPEEDLTARFHGTVYTFYDRFDDSNKGSVQRDPISARHLEEELKRTQDDDAMANLVILCGNQTPSSIAGLANVCNLDPEYLRRHFRVPITEDYSPSPDEMSDDLSLPSLPSFSENIVILRYTTIGRAPHGLDEDTRRKQHDRSPLSKSIVRNISWHKAGYVSIEQEVSACVKHYDTRNYWLGFVWFDSGNEPWWHPLLNIEKGFKLLPIFPYKRTPAPRVDSYLTKPPDTNKGYQSAQRLHQHYGEDLDNQTMGADAFYAFHGLFQFCAFSEIQFLNLMEKQLRLWRSDRDSTRTKGTAFDYEKLEQTRLLIEDHLTYLEETIEIIKRRQNSSDWPVATKMSDIRTTEIAARQLLTDYTHLQQRARRLLRLYEDKTLAPKMDTVRTAHSLTSFHKKYSGEIRNFLLLLIFVATFYSMNLTELQDLPVWSYFATLALLVGSVIAIHSGLSFLMQVLDSINHGLLSKDGTNKSTNDVEDKIRSSSTGFSVSRSWKLAGTSRRGTASTDIPL